MHCVVEEIGMKKRILDRNRMPWALLALVVFLTATGSLAQDAGTPASTTAGDTERLRAEVARLKREIARAENDIRRNDSLSREEQATAARNRERLTRDKERREKENAALESRVRETRARTAAEKAREGSYKSQAAEIAAREKTVLAFLAVVADSLAARVHVGLPWDVSARSDRILSLQRDITAGATTPDEAFARLSALLREEIKNGDEVTVSTRPLTRQNGEVVNAQILKIGNQALVYVDDESKKYGILEPRVNDTATTWVWRENLSLSERSAVKRAVGVKAGREAPQLVPLSIPLAGLLGNSPLGNSISEPDTSTGATVEGGR
jgi:hypothetical protein